MNRRIVSSTRSEASDGWGSAQSPGNFTAQVTRQSNRECHCNQVCTINQRLENGKNAASKFRETQVLSTIERWFSIMGSGDAHAGRLFPLDNSYHRLRK
jgi:hypothetical protein